MELKRVLAADSRAAKEKAMRLYGRDALILSNDRVNGQVELIVAVDLVAMFASSTGSVINTTFQPKCRPSNTIQTAAHALLSLLTQMEKSATFLLRLVSRLV